MQQLMLEKQPYTVQPFKVTRRSSRTCLPALRLIQMWRTRTATRPSCFCWRATSTLTSRGIACRPSWTATRLTWMSKILMGTAWRIWQGNKDRPKITFSWCRLHMMRVKYLMIVNFQWLPWAAGDIGHSQAEERGGEEKVGNMIFFGNILFLLNSKTMHSKCTYR